MQSEEEKPKTAKEDQEQAKEISVGGREVSAAYGMLRCPKCESSLIRKPIGPTLVIISAVVFVILSASGVLLRVLGFERAREVFLPALVISMLAIFVTSCVAFAGRHRCLSCGYRFRSMVKAKRRWMGPFFPRRFVIINAVFIFVFFTLSEILKLIYHGILSIMILRTVFVVIDSFLWILLSLGYQVLLYEILKKRIKHNLVWAILFILPAIILGTNCVYMSLPTVTANRILTLAELAPLPTSARNIKVYEWSCVFSGGKFLRFSASPSDIQKFLKESPILQGAECEAFSAERMRVRYPDDSKKWGQINEAEHETFIPNPSAPDWYKGEIRKGRRYIIHPEWGYYPGEVIVNDEENFVYVNIIWS